VTRLYRATGDSRGWLTISESDTARRVDWAPNPQSWRPATMPERYWWEMTRARFSIVWVLGVLAVFAFLVLVGR